MKKKIIPIIVVAILLALIIPATILICKYKLPHKYSSVIETKNIEYVEYKANRNTPLAYDSVNYTTLTKDEQSKFIDSLSSAKFKYWPHKGGYKGMFYNTFAIHYTDGSMILFDEHHIEKLDKNNNRVYDKILIADNVQIYDNLFK